MQNRTCILLLVVAGGAPAASDATIDIDAAHTALYAIPHKEESCSTEECSR